MTFSDIENELKQRGLLATESWLVLAIRDEMQLLLKDVRRTQDKRNEALTSAREKYATAISACLDNPAPLVPVDILGNRIKPTAWAVAETLRISRQGDK